MPRGARQGTVTRPGNGRTAEIAGESGPRLFSVDPARPDAAPARRWTARCGWTADGRTLLFAVPEDGWSAVPVSGSSAPERGSARLEIGHALPIDWR